MSGIRCSLCNITLNSQEQYSVHQTGKKHLSKLRSTIIQPKQARKDTAPATGTLYGKFVKSSSAVSKSECPGNDRDLQPKLSSPIQSLSQADDSDSPPPPPPPPPHPLDLLIPRIRPPIFELMSQGITQKSGGQLPKPIFGQKTDQATVTNNESRNLNLQSGKRKFYEGRCDVCGIDFNSESQEQAHMIGSKHAKKMRLQNFSSENNFCKYCGVHWNSESQRDQHLSSEVHHKKEAAANVSRTQLNHVPVTAEVQQNNSVPETGNSGTDLGFCEYCMVHYTSESVKFNHLNGQKHKKRTTIGHAKLDKNIGIKQNGMEKVDKQTYFTCQFCGVKLNSLQQLEVHRAGQKHRDQVNKHKAQGKNIQEEEITMATF